MSIGWIRVDVGLQRDWRAAELRAELKEPLADAYPVRLWTWAADNARDGVIPGRKPEPILEHALEWTGTPGELVRALVVSGFLVRVGERLEIVGWEESNGAAIRKSEKDARVKRVMRARGAK